MTYSLVCLLVLIQHERTTPSHDQIDVLSLQMLICFEMIARDPIRERSIPIRLLPGPQVLSSGHSTNAERMASQLPISTAGEGA